MDTTTAGTRPGLHQQAIWLEQFFICWMLIEAGVAVTAGSIAGSLALTAFGLDSVIELVSAVLVLRRLRAELADGNLMGALSGGVIRLIAVTFYALAAYVVVSSAIDLAASEHPENSPAGIGLTISLLLIMPLLGWRKRRVGARCRATRWSRPTPRKPSRAPPSPPRNCPGWSCSPPSAGGKPIPSLPWRSPTSPSARAAKPGTET